MLPFSQLVQAIKWKLLFVLAFYGQAYRSLVTTAFLMLFAPGTSLRQESHGSESVRWGRLGPIPQKHYFLQRGDSRGPRRLTFCQFLNLIWASPPKFEKITKCVFLVLYFKIGKVTYFSKAIFCTFKHLISLSLYLNWTDTSSRISWSMSLGS